MDHRRQANPKEIKLLGAGTRGDYCRIIDAGRAVIVKVHEN